MNAGELRERVEVLSLERTEDGFAWGTSAKTWAKAEPEKGTNLFSKVGTGVTGERFTLRVRKDFTLHNALRWRGRFCFLTSMDLVDGMYLSLSAALIEPRICRARAPDPESGKFNRTQPAPENEIVFPGVLTEKYLRFSPPDPMARTETLYVLVTPKAVQLDSGQLVYVDNRPYTVQVVHELGEYKNEYEIYREDNV